MVVKAEVAEVKADITNVNAQLNKALLTLKYLTPRNNLFFLIEAITLEVN